MQPVQTSVDKPLWTLGFVGINLANLLVMMSIYMLLPLGICRMGAGGETVLAEGGCTAFLAYGAGLFLPGAFCNYWLDTYRRKNVALWAGVLLLLCNVPGCWTDISRTEVCVLRLIQGMAVAVFQITLGSTLLLDLTLSPLRTQAAHVYYWFTRFALSLGPLLSYVALRYVETEFLFVIAGALVAGALVLVMGLKVPFRTPLEPSKFSMDRFWLGKAQPLFWSFLPVMIASGMMLGELLSVEFCAWLMAGYVPALMLRHYIFRREDITMEVLTGMVLLVGSCILSLLPAMLCQPVMVAVCLGAGIGLVSSRFQLLFIRVTEHCERGTAQSTYMLAWEAGLSLGLFGGGWIAGILSEWAVRGFAIVLLICALLFFILYVYRWFTLHCCR